jgi:three-Cys-motif partner protein
MAEISTTEFFQEQRVQSRVKSEIVSKFVRAWAQVLINHQKKSRQKPKVAYIDLFSGPGTYEDDSRSTPLFVIEEALKHKWMREALCVFFNDRDRTNIQSLQQEIFALDKIESLANKPTFYNEEASIKLIDSFRLSPDVPQFFFLDPFGYKSISLELLQRAFQARACDCAFFFNYRRIIAALNNPAMAANMTKLFGADRAQDLRQRLEAIHSAKRREEMVLQVLEETLTGIGITHFIAYPFRSEEARRATHHLVYVTKHAKGLEIMKDIMGRASTRHEEGVPVFGFSEQEPHPMLFTPTPIADLERMLEKEFQGKSMTVGDIFSVHHKGKPYILPNYQEALKRLEESGKVVADPPANLRPTRNGRTTMGINIMIKFIKGQESV